jgi:hypothetical protein
MPIPDLMGACESFTEQPGEQAGLGRQATDFEVVACEPRTRFAFLNTSGPLRPPNITPL